MAWELQIHTIDVGQGESSLIVARDTAAGGQHRTMLIDGGEAGFAETVHNYVAAQLGPLGIPLDHILVSHYDGDHSGGVTALLQADNLWRVCDLIAGPVAVSANLGRNRPEQVAYGAAAAAWCICNPRRQ
jgi:beta-lactamase superfamily II metal-dependent hydrolase